MNALGKYPQYKRLLHIILCAITLLSTFSVKADDLMEIFKAAEVNDATFRAAFAQYRATRQNVPISRSALLPTIDASAFDSSGTSVSPRYNEDTLGFNVIESDTESEGWNVTLSQSLYNHANWVSLKQANLQAAQAEADYQNARQNLIIRVAEAYFNVLASKDALAFAEAQKKSVSQQLEQTKQRYEVGLIAITDVKESQASYDLAVAEEIQARNRLDTTQEALRTITNRYSEAINTLKDNILFKSPEPDDVNEWINTALAQNFSLKSAQLAADIAHKEVSRQRAEHYPSLSLSANKRETTQIGGQFGDLTSEDDSVSINLSIPLFSGGRIRASVKQAIFREEAAKEQSELQKRTVTQQTRNFYRTVIADISRVKALNQALESTQAAYEATNAGFEVGTRNSAEVLVALRETFRAKQNYSQARYDYILNTLRLKQSAGTLKQADLIAINHWLN